MKVINGVKFYGLKDMLYSRGGPIVLDSAGEPLGVYAPVVPGLSDDPDTLDENDESVKTIANNFKGLVGVQ